MNSRIDVARDDVGALLPGWVAAAAAQPNAAHHAMISPSHVPTKVHFGAGCAAFVVDIVNDLLAERGGSKILVVTGAPSTKKAWMVELEERLLHFDPVVIRNRISNPTVASVAEVLEAARRAQVDTIIGIGGGSVLDTAKAVAALARSGLTVENALAHKAVSDTPLTFLAIPTTFGTGSEVTASASIWDDRTKLKYSLATKAMFPSAALVDPLLGATMPRAIVAGTGFDVLSHAIESVWSINSTLESVKCGIAAIRLVTENLERAVFSVEDADARINVALASLLAGFSIAQAQTTIAHAVSYPLTARYGVHHGHACGLSLGALLSFNNEVGPEDCQDRRGFAYVRNILDRVIAAVGATDAAEAEARIYNLITRTGLKTLDQMEVVDLGLVASDVVGYDRFGNNPRRMSVEQLGTFLAQLKTPLHRVI